MSVIWGQYTPSKFSMDNAWTSKPWKFPLQTNIVLHDEKTNRAIAIDHVTLNMYKHAIKSCLTRTPLVRESRTSTPPEFNEWTKK